LSLQSTSSAMTLQSLNDFMTNLHVSIAAVGGDTIINLIKLFAAGAAAASDTGDLNAILAYSADVLAGTGYADMLGASTFKAFSGSFLVSGGYAVAKYSGETDYSVRGHKAVMTSSERRVTMYGGYDAYGNAVSSRSMKTDDKGLVSRSWWSGVSGPDGRAEAHAAATARQYEDKGRSQADGLYGALRAAGRAAAAPASNAPAAAAFTAVFAGSARQALGAMLAVTSFIPAVAAFRSTLAAAAGGNAAALVPGGSLVGDTIAGSAEAASFAITAGQAPRG